MGAVGTSRRAVALVVLVAVLGLQACADDDPDVRAEPEPPVVLTPSVPEVPTITEAPSVPPAGDCPNQADAATNPLNRTAGPLIGDVTGDGAPDRLYLWLDQAAPAGCQAFLVISETTPIAAPIEGWDPSAGIASPTFNGLYEIDGRPGAEIVVVLASGASTQFVGAFTASNGFVERLRTSATDETSSGNNDLFAFGGSVGHLEAVDCTEDGRVVVSSAIPRGERYQVSRNFYEAAGAILQLQASASRRAVVTAQEIEDFPEFARSPFGSCPTA